MMVMSMESRAFGAYPQRTFVDAPQMTLGRRSRSASSCWWPCWPGTAALALGYVHTMYVLAPA